MRKPTLKTVKRGVKGNRYQIYWVGVDGKRYFHLFKKNALIQYNAVMRLYKKKKKRQKR